MSESLSRPEVAAFYEHRTGSMQYIVSDPEPGLCAIVDPVLDYDGSSWTIATNPADALLDHVREQQA